MHVFISPNLITHVNHTKYVFALPVGETNVHDYK